MNNAHATSAPYIWITKLLYMATGLLSRITTDPSICHGQPVVRGLRYPVENMLELLASGMSHEEILADYPDLEPDDLFACLAFAVQLSQLRGFYPLAR